MEEKNDEQLLAGLASGDMEAGRLFFLKFRQKAYRVAYRFLGNDADALDAVADSFAKVMGAAASFRGESSVRTWYYRVLVNSALDIRRKRRRLLSIDALGDEDDESSAAQMAVSREEDPEAAVERGELGEKVREAIGALDDKHRAVFVLSAIEGLSYKEMAETLGISIGTVMSRLFYARKYLQKSLKGYLGARDERV